MKLALDVLFFLFQWYLILLAGCSWVFPALWLCGVSGLLTAWLILTIPLAVLSLLLSGCLLVHFSFHR